MKTSLSRTNLLREIRKMRFEEVYGGWQERRLTQEEAARVLGMSERTFRRQVGRYQADGLDGLIDRRIEQLSSRRAPVDEAMRVVNLYQSRHDGWNVQHFHTWYRCEGVGTRSYSWVKNVLQAAAAVPQAKARGKHRRKRERRSLPGMLLHQELAIFIRATSGTPRARRYRRRRDAMSCRGYRGSPQRRWRRATD
jgi:transposase